MPLPHPSLNMVHCIFKYFIFTMKQKIFWLLLLLYFFITGEPATPPDTNSRKESDKPEPKSSTTGQSDDSSCKSQFSQIREDWPSLPINPLLARVSAPTHARLTQPKSKWSTADTTNMSLPRRNSWFIYNENIDLRLVQMEHLSLRKTIARGVCVCVWGSPHLCSPLPLQSLEELPLLECQRTVDWQLI